MLPLNEEANILYGMVGELLKEGNDQEALNVAKQGFAGLQKIKQPVNSPSAAEFLFSYPN